MVTHRYVMLLCFGAKQQVFQCGVELIKTIIMNLNTKDINELRNKLINVKYEEVLMWSDESLVENIFHNGLPWFKLLQWLLSQLDGGIDTALAGLTGDKLLEGMKETITDLGFCSQDAKDRVVSGVVKTKERQKLCLRLIESIELLRNHGDTAASTNDMMGEELESILSTCHKLDLREKDESPVLPDSLSQEEYDKEILLLNERIARDRLKIQEYKEKLGVSDREVTASEYYEELVKERETLSGKLTLLVESVKSLSEEVEQVFHSEISAVLPVNAPAPVEMPVLDSLSEIVDHIVKVESDQKIVSRCETELSNRLETIEDDWSIDSTASLPVFELRDLAASIVNMDEMTTRKCGS